MLLCCGWRCALLLCRFRSCDSSGFRRNSRALAHPSLLPLTTNLTNCARSAPPNLTNCARSAPAGKRVISPYEIPPSSSNAQIFPLRGRATHTAQTNQPIYTGVWSDPTLMKPRRGAVATNAIYGFILNTVTTPVGTGRTPPQNAAECRAARVGAG